MNKVGKLCDKSLWASGYIQQCIWGLCSSGM